MRTAVKILIAVFFLVLLVSVGLNLYDRYVMIPGIQADMNNKDVRAFNSWVHLMGLTSYFLNSSRTNFDLNNASYTVRVANELTDIFTPSLESLGGAARNLSYSLGYGTSGIGYALDAVMAGNQIGTVHEVELPQPILDMIVNLTRAIGHVVYSAEGRVDTTGVSLAQQLQEHNLIDPLTTYCNEIINIGNQMYEYYHPVHG